MKLFRLAFFSICILVAGCVGGARSERGLVVGIEVEPQTLDPRYAADAYSAKISNLVFSGLVSVDDHFNIQPELAESYRVLQGTHYLFRLRPGLKFSDGTPLTADDVVATIGSVIHPASTSPLKSGFEVIWKIRALGSKEIEIWLKSPYAPFLSLMTLGIVPRQLPGRIGWSAEELIGCGPYRWIKRTPGESLQLVANEYYWGEVPLEPLTFRVIPDETTRALELIHGRIDLVLNGVPPLLLNTLAKRGLQVVSAPGGNASYLMFNLRHPALQDLRVRQAIAHAIPVDLLMRYRLAGRARRGAGLLSPEHWAFESQIESYPYNPETAARLLDEAGYPDPDGPGPRPRLVLTYKTSNRKDRVMMVTLIMMFFIQPVSRRPVTTGGVMSIPGWISW